MANAVLKSDERMSRPEFLEFAGQIQAASLTWGEFASSGNDTGYDVYFQYSSADETLARVNSGTLKSFNPDLVVDVHSRTGETRVTEKVPDPIEWVYEQASAMGLGNLKERGITPARVIMGFWALKGTVVRHG